MDAFLQWLSANPTVTNTLLFAISGLVLAVALIYVVSFLQGREISFWPPKIGQRIDGKKQPEGKTSERFPNTSSIHNSAEFLRLEHSKEIFQFSEKLKMAKSIWINGYSCAQLFKEFKSEIERALINGTNFKIIITKPNSIATKMMEARDIHAERVVVDINYVVSEIKAIKDVISIMAKSKTVGSIDVKFIDWLPSCSMIFYNPDEEDGELKIKVYPPFYSTNHFNPIEIIIDNKNHQDQFNYFREQYNRLWNREPGTFMP